MEFMLQCFHAAIAAAQANAGGDTPIERPVAGLIDDAQSILDWVTGQTEPVPEPAPQVGWGA